MDAVLGDYWLAIVLSAVVVVASLMVAANVADACAGDGRPALGPVSRVLAIGSVGLILVTTALPHRWPPGPRGYVGVDLALGHGGLADWRAVFEHPTSAPALLFVGNILLYVPFALFATVGWPRRRPSIVLVSALMSGLIELVQYAWLGRTAAVDDVVLNLTGAIVGCAFGSLIVACSSSRGGAPGS
jgi:VanZ like family